MSQDSWKYAPDDAQFIGGDCNPDVPCFYKCVDGVWFYIYPKDGFDVEWESMTGYPLHLPLIPRPETVAEGDSWYNMGKLPPIGSKVALKVNLYDPTSGEVFEVPYHKSCVKDAEVEIVAHFDCMPGCGESSPVAAFTINTKENSGFHAVFQATSHCFKPIDTEAKRLAEALKVRKELIDQIAEDFGYGDDEVHVLYDLYDAGRLII